jgi:signal transduction histidine kinase/ActR/RegA family two-component response regulator
MKLARKSALVIGGVVAAGGALMGTFAYTTLLDRFRAIENQRAIQKALLAKDTFEEAVRQLDLKLADWSSWDASYAYVSDPAANETYVAENLLPDGFTRMRLSMMLFLNRAGERVFAKQLSPDGTELIDVPASVIEEVRAGRPLVAVDHGGEVETGVSGVLCLPEGTLVAVSRPILKSDGGGASAGTLIFAYWFDESRAEALGKLTHLNLSVRSLRESDEYASIEPVVRALSEEVLTSRVVLPDMYGDPRFELMVTSSRDILAQGKRTITTILWLGAALFAACGVTGTMLLRRTVLARIADLDQQARSIATDQSRAARVRLEGSDELSSMASSINQMLERLDSARLAAEASARTKSDFLANMSHEIRTPMTAILGFTDLLLDSSTRETEREEFARRIRAGGEHLLNVINDILDFSKIDAGAMKVEKMDADPSLIASEIVSMTAHRAVAKGLAMRMEFATPMPAVIKSDPTRLRQILLNLIGNAIKFTERGEIVVRAELTSAGDVRFSVIDTGVGIAPEVLPRMFRAFEQADTSMTRRFGGTGLGLAISKRLALLLGGDIAVTSTLGRGSTFVCTIPAGDLSGVELLHEPGKRPTRTIKPSEGEIAGGTQAAKASPPAASGAGVSVTRSDTMPLTGVRLLVVEDGPDNQRLVTRLLQSAGATVRVAGNGREGVDAVRAALSPFHVVLMDMQMPVLDGYTATAELRALGVRTPIIAFTAHALPEEQLKSRAAGCDDYLTKPIRREKLLEMCMKWAAGNEEQRAAA